jgi:hypothetical protein
MSSDPAPAPSAAPAMLPPPAVSPADAAPRPPTAAGALLFRPFSGRSSAAGEAIEEHRSSVHEIRGADHEAPRQEDVQSVDPMPFPTWDAGGGAGGDDAWLTLLDLETSHAPDAVIAPVAGGGADGAVEAPRGGESGAAEVAAVLERIARRVRAGDDLTDTLGDGRGSSLEALIAGVVAGYLRGRGAADR